MNVRKMLLAMLMMSLSAGSAFAALSAQNQEWAKGPAQHLMTKEEQKQWKAVKTDEEAQKFIDLFWARRDPDPRTPQNEAKARFEQLVKTADQRYAYQRTKGSMTERGKVWILLGPPSRVETSGPGEIVGNIQSGFLTDASSGATTADQDKYPAQRWIYEKDRIPPFSGKKDLDFIFNDRFATGDFRLGRSSTTNSTDVLNQAAAALVVTPNLTEVPVAPAQVLAPVQPEGAVPGVEAPLPKVFKTESLKMAIDEFKKASANPYKNAYITWGEFITPEGEYFVPVQLYVPKADGLTATSTLTFFSLVEDAQGNIIGVWEEPATLAESKTDFFYDKSLSLPAGKYTAVFGLAQDGKPVTAARANLNLASLTKDGAGASKLLISNNIYPLSAAQNPTDPFAFGGIKVVPKGDRTFAQSDELWYFFELRNPGVDATTSAPKVQVKVDVEGTTSTKKKVKLGAPLSEAVAEPLKGVAGHYGVGSSIPLSGFDAGEYTLKLKVIDTISKQTYNMEQPFKVTK